MKNFYAQSFVLSLICGVLAYSPTLMGQNSQRLSPPAAGFADFTIRALRAEPGKASLYDIHFTTRDTLDPLAEMTFEFSRDLDLSLLELASSTSINGGFKIFREGNLVRVRRTGLGETIPPGKKVELKLGLITSPQNLSANHEVAFELRSSTGKLKLDRIRLPIQFSTAQ
ncbi:hypothetical protein HUU05_08640 [candidate division KSB1 bacterium]|nr:hypothetical protein [candidate division KSB1 bacterium]